MSETLTVSVIGLGYVGLPLAVALAKRYNTHGFDIDRRRISELRDGLDRTTEIDPPRLRASALVLTDDPAALPPSDFYILTVPTPINRDREPDLSIVRAATRMVGELLKVAYEHGKKPIVVYESTVYPGVTEEVCAPILEHTSGKKWKRDFFLGYSPERINPGDREHTIDKITKVVSGDTPETLNKISSLYNAITEGGVFEANSIRAAEAAKVIENAQRDINIAFINEITQIFSYMDLSVWDVLEAARTKWNFLPFSPGLVGGHCISVDPYYLSHRAKELGHDPRVILAGRGVNDNMAHWVATRIDSERNGIAGRILVLGLSFKENVPDLRNSKVADLVYSLVDFGHAVTVHDPLADAAEADDEYGLKIDKEALRRKYDTVLLAVPHREYLDLGVGALRELLTEGGTLCDLKGALGNAADWTL